MNSNRRRGFMLAELLVAMAFFAVAISVAIQVHQASLRYDRASIDRLQQRLVVENVAEILQAVSDSDLERKTPELAQLFGVRATVDPFKSGTSRGWHVTLRADSARGSVVHHLWRLESKS